LAWLAVEAFRSLADQRIDFPTGRALLVGPNGCGKTSVLEAIYVAATTKSFRTPQLADCVRHGADACAVRLGAPQADLAVGWRNAERWRAVNGKSASLAEHLTVQPVVAWTTAERDLLTGEPAARRSFFDRGLVAERPLALQALQRYQRALAAKRALLAAGARGDLAAWNELLATSGAEIVALRKEQARRLAEGLRETLARANFPFPEIRLEYRPNPPLAGSGASTLRDALEKVAADERRRRMPLVGPHRDDFVLRWGAAELRRVASAGERKALGLCVLAAQVRNLELAGRGPLVLLDDADTELDRVALARVWELFSSRSVIASSNRPEAWEGLAVEARYGLAGGVASAA
jgi:DNA replication and repair protein RecF